MHACIRHRLTVENRDRLMGTDFLVFGRLLTTLATIVACSGNNIGTRVLARSLVDVITPAPTRFHAQVCVCVCVYLFMCMYVCVVLVFIYIYM